jgi:hypothetical protein
MSQNPGQYPGQQPWGGAQQPDPQPAPDQGGQPGYGTQPGYASQPPYGTSPTYPAQPGYGTQPGYAPQPHQYPGQPVYGQPAYGQPTYGQPVYGQPAQQFVAAPYQPASAATGPRNPVLGFIALGVVVLATLASLAGGWRMLADMQPFLAGSIYTGSTDSEAVRVAITGPITAIVTAATVGFAGWIAGIVAAATNRGRVAGILAIVVGVIAPFVIWGYIGFSIAAMAQQ